MKTKKQIENTVKEEITETKKQVKNFMKQNKMDSFSWDFTPLFAELLVIEIQKKLEKYREDFVNNSFKLITIEIMKNMYGFGDIVVVEENLVGVVVKIRGGAKGYNYDVYVRSFNRVENYRETQIQRFVYDKELSEEDLEFYN